MSLHFIQKPPRIYKEDFYIVYNQISVNNFGILK